MPLCRAHCQMVSFFVSFQSWRVGTGNASNPSRAAKRKLGNNLRDCRVQNGHHLFFREKRDNTSRPLLGMQQQKEDESLCVWVTSLLSRLRLPPRPRGRLPGAAAAAAFQMDEEAQRSSQEPLHVVPLSSHSDVIMIGFRFLANTSARLHPERRKLLDFGGFR